MRIIMRHFTTKADVKQLLPNVGFPTSGRRWPGHIYALKTPSAADVAA
jgi:hypothetical protein